MIQFCCDLPPETKFLRETPVTTERRVNLTNFSRATLYMKLLKGNNALHVFRRFVHE